MADNAPENSEEKNENYGKKQAETECGDLENDENPINGATVHTVGASIHNCKQSNLLSVKQLSKLN